MEVKDYYRRFLVYEQHNKSYIVSENIKYNFYTNRIRDIKNEIQGRKHNIVSRVIKDFDQQKIVYKIIWNGIGAVVSAGIK